MSKPMSNGQGWQLDRATAERLANELGWRIGQSLDGGKLLYRPGLAEPIPCKSWLAMATYLIDYIERRRGGGAQQLTTPNVPPRPIQPVQRTSVPAQARTTRLGQIMRRAGPEDEDLPHGKILG